VVVTSNATLVSVIGKLCWAVSGASGVFRALGKVNGHRSMSKVVDYEYERLEPIPASYGCAGIVLSVAFFQTLNQTVLRVGSPKAVGRENYWKWRNLVVSWMHALIVGVWDITWYVDLCIRLRCHEIPHRAVSRRARRVNGRFVPSSFLPLHLFNVSCLFSCLFSSNPSTIVRMF